MNKQLFVGLATGILASPTFAIQKGYPNIVFVLVDDMGIGDINCYFEQPKISTPHIDELAQQSLMFMQHYAGSTVSAPSRCCLMTGKHTGHAWIRGNKGVMIGQEKYDQPLRADEVTVAELLKSKGYATMCVGKWGLGGPGSEGSPIRQGFDYFFGYLSQGAAHRYYPEYLYENEEKVMLNHKVYSHALIMQKGMDFLRKQKEDTPVFAYFAITPPHADLDYPDMSQYENDFAETPFINHGKKGFHTQMKPKAAYASMISEIDRNVGDLVELLKEQGKWENTIFIFSSDNGVHRKGGHDPEFFNSNGPYRGYKRDLYEGGVRTPFIVSWPKVIDAPRKTTHIATFWDFLPTVCDIVGCQVPTDVDGISYLPTLRNEEQEQEQHECVYYEFYEEGGKQAVLQDGWKLVRLNMSHPNKLKEELYYLPDDIGERHNLIKQHKQKADELRKLAMKQHTESKIYEW